MKPFQNAQIGDRVFAEAYGEGIVLKIDRKDEHYQLHCLFNARDESYNWDGKEHDYHTNRTLWYLDAEGNKCAERPTRKIKASLLPVDTKLVVWTDEDSDVKRRRYFAGGNKELFCWANGATSWSEAVTATWPHATLAEELTIDGTLYPIGTEVEV